MIRCLIIRGVLTPLDLEIADPGNVTWNSSGYLTVNSSTIMSSGVAASKIIDASVATNELSVEAWIAPANTTQSGPARIVTLSPNTSERNFTLGQNGDQYIFRLRTTTNGTQGTDTVVTTASGTVTTNLTHVVFTRDALGDAKIYLNGEIAADSGVVGNLSNWDSSYELSLANEFTLNRTWLGEIYLVAVYNRALGQTEITRNYNAEISIRCCLPEHPPGMVPLFLVEIRYKM